MKLHFAAVALGTLLSSSRGAAFTARKSLLRPPAHTRPTTVLRSSVAERIDAIAVAAVPPAPQPQRIEEEQLVSRDGVTAATNDAKSYLDDGFVFGLAGSGLERPKGKVATLVYEGDSMDTTPLQLATVAATFAGQALLAVHDVQMLFEHTGGDVPATAIVAAATVAASWVAADFGSGCLHWAVDNYGNGRTPVMGNIIAAFQGHHSAPWTITHRGFANNVWKLCIPFGLPTVAAITYLAGPEHPISALFWTVFCFTEIMSQEFHKWSHQTPAEAPGLANALMAAGVSIGRVPHAQHHIAPYDGNYCIVSGLCNGPLDEAGFFRWLEHRIFEINGVESNSWKLDPALRERTLRGDYRLPKKARRRR